MGGCPTSTPGSKSRALCKVLFQEMHMWSHYISHNRPPGAPSPGLIAHHQHPKAPRTKSWKGMQANRHHRGGRTAGPAALPAGKTRRGCRFPSPVLFPGGPVRRLRRPLAASVLGGAACNTKGVCGCGCVGGFPGPPAGPSWSPPPYTHPFGALSPPLSRAPPWGLARLQPQVATDKYCWLLPLQKEEVERHWGQYSV